MSNRLFSALAVAAATFGATLAPAFADEAGSVFGAKTVGALTIETRGLATSAADVALQGGAATARTVRWTDGSVQPEGAVYGAGTVGAMFHESAGVATSSVDVARQGGGVTAAAVRWISDADRAGS